MKIKIWGCRGSICAPGQDTVRYGGNTTCVEIRPREGGIIIVDAGSGIRLLGKQLLKEKELAELCLVLTHTHWDHILGFPFFSPAYSNSYKINVYGGPAVQSVLRSYFETQMTAPFFPVEFKGMKASFVFGCECPSIGSIGLVNFIPIALSHPNGGYGFKFVKHGKILVFLTDNELDFAHPGAATHREYTDFCRGADLLIHDAQYTDDEYRSTRGWGHSTYSAVIQLAIESEVKQLCLFHHDPDRTDDDMDRQLDYCRNSLSKAGVATECIAAAEGMEFAL
ncbi:MAG: MBL fold metallo-hydrolase [Syntrophales bacterium]